MSHDLGEIQRETAEAEYLVEMEAFGLMVERACHRKEIKQMLPDAARGAAAALALDKAHKAAAAIRPDRTERNKRIATDYQEAVKSNPFLDKAAIQEAVGLKHGVCSRQVRTILSNAKKRS